MLVLLYFLCMHGHTKVTNIYLGSLCVCERRRWGGVRESVQKMEITLTSQRVCLLISNCEIAKTTAFNSHAPSLCLNAFSFFFSFYFWH